MNYLATVTLGDFVGPEFRAALDLVETDSRNVSEFLTDEQAEWTMSTSMTQWSIWDRLWRFGIIVDDDLEYYIPDDYDTEVALVESMARDVAIEEQIISLLEEAES